MGSWGWWTHCTCYLTRLGWPQSGTCHRAFPWSTSSQWGWCYQWCSTFRSQFTTWCRIHSAICWWQWPCPWMATFRAQDGLGSWLSWAIGLARASEGSSWASGPSIPMSATSWHLSSATFYRKRSISHGQQISSLLEASHLWLLFLSYCSYRRSPAFGLLLREQKR